jgi:hypothetical protein
VGGRSRHEQEQEQDEDLPLDEARALLDERLSKPRRVAAPFAKSAYSLQDQPVYDMATLSFVQGYYKREEDARRKDRFSRKIS